MTRNGRDVDTDRDDKDPNGIASECGRRLSNKTVWVFQLPGSYLLSLQRIHRFH